MNCLCNYQKAVRLRKEKNYVELGHLFFLASCTLAKSPQRSKFSALWDRMSKAEQEACEEVWRHHPAQFLGDLPCCLSNPG